MGAVASQMPKWAGLLLGTALFAAMSIQMAYAAPVQPDRAPLSLKTAATTAKAGFRTFGSMEFRTRDSKYSRKWNRLLRKITAERKLYADCEAGNSACHGNVRAWRKAVRKFGRYDGLDRLAAVNGTVNSLIRYADDSKQFGRSDYWATPIESLSGRGDCEDYVIVKYFMLAELGVPEDKMRVVIVQDTARGIGHAVLAVKHAGKTYVLDSLSNKPRVHTAFKNYRPFFSLNRNGSWVNVKARKRSRRVAAIKPARQTPAQAQAMLPDYAKNQAKPRNVVLRESPGSQSTIQ